EAYKRANNIVGSEWAGRVTTDQWKLHAEKLHEPAELQLREAVTRLAAELSHALEIRQPVKELVAIAAIQPPLAAFFDQVRVVVDDLDLKEARLSLLAELRDRIRAVGDISFLAPKQA